MLQSLATQEFHRDEREPTVEIELEHTEDVRVRYMVATTHFLDEHVKSIADTLLLEHFDGDPRSFVTGGFQLVDRFIYGPEPARPDLASDEESIQ